MAPTAHHFLSSMTARCFLFLGVLCALWVSLCNGACAEVDSDTEAVAGNGFKLGCISCKMRGEVVASAIADWYFRAKGETEFLHIYTYDGETSIIIDDRFEDRVAWNGSRKTTDLQDASIYLHNVTFNDSGVYRCFFRRTLEYNAYPYETTISKVVHLTVVAKATRGTASIISEVMMYVSIIGLQLWLLVEMIYCYRKIAAAGDEALRASAYPQGRKYSHYDEAMFGLPALYLKRWPPRNSFMEMAWSEVAITDKLSIDFPGSGVPLSEVASKPPREEYLAIASESKDNCTGVQVAE